MRDENGRFIKGYGFWTGKKRPGLKTSTTWEKGNVPWNAGKAVRIDKKCKGCDIIMKVEPCHLERQKWHNRQCMADNVGRTGLHSWVNRMRGKPRICEICKTTTAKKYEWSNTSFEYKKELSDWRRLCTSCHRHYDLENGWGKAKLKFSTK